METVCEETPYASIVVGEYIEDYCANCFQETSETQIQCDDCLEVTYCSSKCQRKDWQNVHSLECQILRSQNQPLTPTMRLSIRVLLKKFGKCAEEGASFNGACFEDLETNFDDYRCSESHNKFLNDIMAIIQISAKSSTIFQSVEKSHMIAIICAVLANTFGISNDVKCEEIGVGLYIGMSKHNHECSSKNHVIFEGNRAFLRAPEGTKYDRNLTVSYCSRMLPTFKRQKTISQVHFFTCQCQFCSSSPPEETLITEELYAKLEKTREIAQLRKLRDEYSVRLAVDNLAVCQLDEQIALSLGKLPNRSKFEEEALRGISIYLNRLYLGAPEVTRRLYIACLALENGSEKMREVVAKTLESSELSHGSRHPLTLAIREMNK